VYSSTNHLSLAADAAIDLHLHTTYSDGRWTPEQLLDYLAQEQFSLAAITDHDRPDTAVTLQQLAQDKHLPVLVGVKMTTLWQDENIAQRRDELSGLFEMTDLLCYGFDPERHALCDLAQDLWRRQCENTQEVFENLLQQGYQFPQSADALDTILKKPNPEQPHELAALLRKHGYGTGERSAGRIILEAGCEFAMNGLAAVVDAAHQDGGVCLLAHPGHSEGGFVTYDVQMLDKLHQEIPIDGLEVYHPKHTPAQIEMYREYAQRHRLLISAGSDSHRSDKPPIKYKAELCRDLLEWGGIQME
jgi:predicted metal-dependent phosphoesterase TrpH